MLHELWLESDDEQTFCLSGPSGDSVRKTLSPKANLVWTCEADSYFDAMTQYYQYMNWGEYKTDFPEDKKPYEK